MDCTKCLFYSFINEGCLQGKDVNNCNEFELRDFECSDYVKSIIKEREER